MNPTAATIAVSLALLLAACRPPAKTEPTPEPVTAPEPGALELAAALSGERDTFSFAEVIEATTGRRVLPMPKQSPFLQLLPPVFDAAIAELSAETSPVRQERRINEVSGYFENLIAEEVSAHPDFEAAPPETAEGKTQRSGYPDLLIRHRPSGALAYLDPKLYEQDSGDSSFRSFYYEPKTKTGKILHDAHHLVVGFAHDGVDGEWTFTRWSLVDLSELSVRIKAEFQASNRDLYRDGSVIRSSE